MIEGEIMRTVCEVCMHHCSLKPGQSGLCRARKNIDGRIRCINYGQVTSLALDPIEKKPLAMFRPGSMILSAGSFGCNLSCPFCQNHEISMAGAETAGTYYISPEALAAKAWECRKSGNIGVAFTYNEPLAGWEYVRDTAKLIKEMGMDNVLVTNGTASRRVLEELLPYIDAMNIDLKAFRADTYQSLSGDLNVVKEFIAHAAESCHVELTTLIVPGINDDITEMEEEAGWIASVEDTAGKKIPLHITRFFPRYRMTDRDATEVRQVYRLAETAGKYLEHVFVGNC